MKKVFELIQPRAGTPAASAVLTASTGFRRVPIPILDDIPDDRIPGVTIPTGVPLVYKLDERLHPIRHHYLGDQGEIEKAMAEVRSQAEQRSAGQGKAG